MNILSSKKKQINKIGEHGYDTKFLENIPYLRDKIKPNYALKGYNYWGIPTLSGIRVDNLEENKDIFKIADMLSYVQDVATSRNGVAIERYLSSVISTLDSAGNITELYPSVYYNTGKSWTGYDESYFDVLLLDSCVDMGKLEHYIKKVVRSLRSHNIQVSRFVLTISDRITQAKHDKKDWDGTVYTSLYKEDKGYELGVLIY